MPILPLFMHEPRFHLFRVCVCVYVCVKSSRSRETRTVFITVDSYCRELLFLVAEAKQRHIPDVRLTFDWFAFDNVFSVQL